MRIIEAINLFDSYEERISYGNKLINKVKQNTIRKRANHPKLQEAIKNEEKNKLNPVMQIHKKKFPTPILTCYNKWLEKEKFWI
jgi:hypothetical protein